jgi:putative hydrolase of the HAD superfamily
MIDASIRAVFFDAVGTLIFPRVPIHQTYADIARRHGVHVQADQVRSAFRAAFARQEAIDQSAGWKTDDQRERARWHAIVTEVLAGSKADTCFAELWHYFSTPQAWILHPDTSEVLEELCLRGFALGMASNFDARLFHIVRGFGELSPLRIRFATSAELGWRKPAPEFFAAIIEMAGCRPDEILYVGDHPHNDIAGASAAGLRAILFDPQATTSDSLRIRRLRDLLPGCGL